MPKLSEGQGTENNAAPVVDARTLASAFTESLRQSGLMVAPAQNQQQEADPFEAKFKELAANTEGGEAALKGIKELFQAQSVAIEKKLRSEYRNEQGASTIKQRQQEMLDAAQASVEQFVGDNAALAKRSESITNEVIKEIFINPKYLDAKQKFEGQLIVDKAAIKKIAMEKVNEWSADFGVQKKTAKGPSGMSNSDAPGDGKLPSGDGDADSEDPASLAGRELAYYNARLATAQRAGMRPESKEAKEFALKGVRTFREGKRRAVETLGSRRYHKD